MRTSNAVPLSAEAMVAISRCLWQWLVLGALLSLLLPAASGQWMGTPWFWGVVAPAVSLLTLHRDALVASLRARAVPAARSRATPAMASWRTPSRSAKARRSRPLGHQSWSPSRAA